MWATPLGANEARHDGARVGVDLPRGILGPEFSRRRGAVSSTPRVSRRWACLFVYVACQSPPRCRLRPHHGPHQAAWPPSRISRYRPLACLPASSHRRPPAFLLLSVTTKRHVERHTRTKKRHTATKKRHRDVTIWRSSFIVAEMRHVERHTRIKKRHTATNKCHRAITV
jgi:hypothetical protein